MLRIAFIDHPYHQVTRSADFFVDLLRRRFDVTHYYAGIQTADFVNDVVMGEFDIIVLWQTEYLGPFFLAEGQRVVCVPMYDGSGKVPDFYWHHLRQARVINFSKALHGHINHLGLTSLPVQYMKDPTRYSPTADYSSPRVVFWQRLPEHGIDSALVRKIVGEDALLHVHNAPDSVPSSRYPTPEADIVTYFDLEKNALADAMEWGNVFVCPRYAEGIGMAMLEALSRGMIVIAHNAPTHSDYIENWKTGILIDMANPAAQTLPIDLGMDVQEAAPTAVFDYGWGSAFTPASLIAPRVEDAADAPYVKPDTSIAKMGAAARAHAIKIYEDWLISEEVILDFIEETPHPTGIRMTQAGRAHLARETELWHAHPRAFIERMAYWEDNGICLQDRKLQRKAEKRRMRRRQSIGYKSLRFVFRQFKKMRNKYRWLKHVIRSRM